LHRFAIAQTTREATAYEHVSEPGGPITPITRKALVVLNATPLRAWIALEEDEREIADEILPRRARPNIARTWSWAWNACASTGAHQAERIDLG
jgi:hypothetical protein